MYPWLLKKQISKLVILYQSPSAPKVNVGEHFHFVLFLHILRVFRSPEDGVIGGDVSRCRVFCSAGLVQVLSSITEVQFAVNSAHCSCQVLRRNLRADSRPLSAAWTSTNQGSWLITDST